MGLHPSFPIRNPLLLVFLSLLAFLAGFGLACRQDAVTVSDFGKLAWAHLTYAEELKDDMAVIDWSKNLEKVDSVRAFQVTLDSKSIAEGGNLNFLPSAMPEGAAYLFPSGWSFRTLSTKTSAPLEFRMVFQPWPGPILWGLLACLSMLLGGVLPGFSPRASKTRSSQPELTFRQASAKALQPSLKPAVVPLSKNSPYLFIDKNYVIQQVTAEAAEFLQKKAEDILNGHLLDLAPDPVLVLAFEKGREAKIPRPFPGHPNLSASLKPDPNGCLLILEKAPGA